MHKKLWPSIAATLVGAGLLVMAASAGAASSSTPRGTSAVGKQGGTLHINLSATDTDFTDPALSYFNVGWVIEYATCAKLLNYPDKPSPEGSQLQPEAADGFPKVSNGGRTYAFTIKPGLKFNTGAPVTAANFAYAINRDLNPAMQSPAVTFASDIVGASDVVAGKAKTASGVVAKGNTLTITLTKNAPDFLARIAMPFFCAITLDTPINPQGVTTLPGAGPYYIASRDVNRTIVLKRNPFYKGDRPHNADEIVYTVNTDLNQSLLQVKSGQADWDAGGLPPTEIAGLAQTYGINKSQFFVNPLIETDYLALNTASGRFFADAKIRQAMNYAIDRPAMLRARGFLAGKRTDHVLAPGVPGFKDVKSYPFKGSDYGKAKEVIGGKGGTAVVYTSNRGAAVTQAQVLQFNMKQIGIDAQVKQFATAVMYAKAGTKGEPFDAVLAGWSADYPDPFDFLDVLLNGRNIHETNNNNLAYFDDPKYNKLLNDAAKLSGDDRYKTYGQLDIDITRNAAPWAAFDNRNDRDFLAKRIGCFVYQPIYGPSLGSLCIK